MQALNWGQKEENVQVSREKKATRDQHLPAGWHRGAAGAIPAGTWRSNTAGAYRTQKQHFTSFFSNCFLLRVCQGRDRAKYSLNVCSVIQRSHSLGRAKPSSVSPQVLIYLKCPLISFFFSPQAWQRASIIDQPRRANSPGPAAARNVDVHHTKGQSQEHAAGQGQEGARGGIADEQKERGQVSCLMKLTLRIKHSAQACCYLY